jgi:hypothetical protein
MFYFWKPKKPTPLQQGPHWEWSEQPVFPQETPTKVDMLQEISDTLKRIEKLLQEK